MKRHCLTCKWEPSEWKFITFPSGTHTFRGLCVKTMQRVVKGKTITDCPEWNAKED